MKTSKGNGQRPKLSNPISQLPDQNKKLAKKQPYHKNLISHIPKNKKNFSNSTKKRIVSQPCQKPQYLLYPNLQTKKAYPKIPTCQKPTFLYFQIYKQKQRYKKKTINQEPKSFQLC